MNRQEYNRKIIALLCIKFPQWADLYEELNPMVEKYHDWRFGQIFSNWDSSEFPFINQIDEFYETIFDSSDPFFEESEDTYERLMKIIKK